MVLSKSLKVFPATSFSLLFFSDYKNFMSSLKKINSIERYICRGRYKTCPQPNRMDSHFLFLKAC